MSDRDVTDERGDSVAGLRDRTWVLAIFLTALALRIVYLAQNSPNPLLYAPVLDEALYIRMGKAIASGYLLGENRVFFMDPLYGYFLGLVFFIFGDNLTVVRLIQILLDSFNAVLIYLIGARVWDRRAGAVAGMLYAVYKISFYYTLLALKTTGTVTLLLLFTLALIETGERGRVRAWGWLGLFAAALVYFRANTLVMAPMAPALYWLIHRPDWRTFARNTAVFGAALAAALSLGAARNWWVGGELVMVNTQSGRLLYASNNPENLTGRYNVPSFSRPNPEESERDFHAEAERRLGRKLSPKEVSSYWTGETLKFLWGDPGAALTLAFNKIRGTLGDYEIPNNNSAYTAERFSSIARLPLPTFWAALAFGAPGLVLGAVYRRRVLWLFAPVVMTAVTIMLFYTSSRFRLPAVPFMIIGAGIFFAVMADWAAARRWRRMITPAVAAAVLAAASLSVPAPPGTGNEETHLARAYWKIGDLENARRVALAAAERYPDQARFQVLLGMIALSGERYEEAARRNREAIRLNPGEADAYHNMGLVELAGGRHGDAVEWFGRAYALNPRPESLFAMARAYDMAGDEARAAETYRRVMAATQPGSALRARAEKQLRRGPGGSAE